MSQFGLVELGAPRSEFGPRLKPSNGTACVFDCDYIDGAGITYTVGEDETLERKSIENVQGKTPPKLPFGLTSNDSVASAVKKMHAVKGSAAASMGFEYGEFVVSEARCITSVQHKDFDFEMRFDAADRLTSVRPVSTRMIEASAIRALFTKASRFTFVCILACIMEDAVAAPASRPLRYEPAVVLLTGRVIKKFEYGPPNYGENPETDSHGYYAFLVPDKPFSVEAKKLDDLDGQSFSGIDLVQLTGDDGVKIYSYVGKHVTLTGTLFESFTAHHYTDVLMDVSKVQVRR